MFTTGEKFDKDCSVRIFTRISKDKANTVITVFALLAIKVFLEAKVTLFKSVHF